ncbi:MAG: M15 family metallopeptidase [Flavobacterium sp.]|jgi:D-alanyl-D-alanine dipeptidase|nr:M15 family metallopeptidase [Flavobacterium sp.]
MKKHLILLLFLAYNLSIKAQVKEIKTPVSDTTFVKLSAYSSAFVYDLKYATTDNFLGEKVYNCGECYLRYKTVKALLVAQEKIKSKGYKFKLFDCYRPLSVQQKMWALVSDPAYVADPAKGSLHNRGGAVDLTLVDKNGNELDFGTTFDFFGEQASHSYLELDKEVIKNRTFLRKVMTENGFTIFPSEWWHYNIEEGQELPIANFSWPCN